MIYYGSLAVKCIFFCCSYNRNITFPVNFLLEAGYISAHRPFKVVVLNLVKMLDIWPDTRF